MELETLKRDTEIAARGLAEAARLEEGQIMVVGCSTSEVLGHKIGTAGSEEVAAVILEALLKVAGEYKFYLAVQCCEHLNRALVVERPLYRSYNLERVEVVPVPHAGGALAATAIKNFQDPVIVENIQAHAGIDIGSTLIGMHLKAVAVPVRLQVNTIGEARLTAARTRPKLIGGSRAVYITEN